MISFSEPPRVPAIDLSLFDIGDPWRDHVAAQVDWAASAFGLFQILGHGVDSALIDTLQELGGKYIRHGSDQLPVAGKGPKRPFALDPILNSN